MRVAIDANIGAGKSTVLEAIQKAYPDVAVYQEELEAWNDLLTLFYANKSRWAFALQMRILLEYLKAGSTTTTTKKTVITERCLHSSRYVFAQTLYGEGALSEKEWHVYKEYYDCFDDKAVPDVLIYIKTDPETCWDRVRKRARPSEETITLDYLKKLNFQYDTMVKYFPGTVHVVDGSGSEAAVFENVKEILDGLYYHHYDGPPPVRRDDQERDEVQAAGEA